MMSKVDSCLETFAVLLRLVRDSAQKVDRRGVDALGARRGSLPFSSDFCRGFRVAYRDSFQKLRELSTDKLECEHHRLTEEQLGHLHLKMRGIRAHYEGMVHGFGQASEAYWAIFDVWAGISSDSFKPSSQQEKTSILMGSIKSHLEGLLCMLNEETVRIDRIAESCSELAFVASRSESGCTAECIETMGLLCAMVAGIASK